MTTLEKIVQKLPFNKIVGQTLIGYAEDVKSFEELKKIVLENALGGLIIGRSVLSSLKPSRGDLKELADSYRKAFGFSPILAAEHEGGRLEGLPPPATELPSPMGVSATGDTKSAYIVGYITALELRTLNINTNLAPVANLYPYGCEAGSEENSFGEDPEEVSDYVLSYIRGLRNGGVLSFAKYFPRRFYGQRDEALESLSKLYKKEFKPFQMAFKSGVEGIVIGHAPLPAVDSVSTPSSFSPRVVEKIVKREMGFKNILLTDHSDDKEILDKFDPEEAAIKSLEAGNHLVVPSKRIEDLHEALNSIIEKTGKNKDLYNRIRNSALEVLSFKLRKLEKFKKTPEKTRGSLVNQAKAWKIFLKSITIIKGVEELPLRWVSKPMVVVTNGFNELLEEADRKRLRDVLKEVLKEFSLLEYLEETPSKKLSEIYRNTPGNTLLIILAYNVWGSRKEVSVLEKLIEFFRESVAISFGSPRDLTLLSDAKVCVAAFTPSVTAVKASLKALMDKSKPSGRLPVKIELG